MAENKSARLGQKLRGAVLIMVVTVMFMLIILLLATLTVVSTAQNRAYLKYEENQAYYTARSALDVYTNCMLDDSTYKAYDTSGVMKYYYIDTDGSVKNVDMKQGLALQLDLYNIKSQGLETAKAAAAHDPSKFQTLGKPNADAYKALGLAENMETSDKIFGDSGDFLKVNAHFGVSDNALNDDADTSKQKDYIEYQVTLPEIGSTTNDYGGIVDSDSSGQIATIKVEVLNREYASNPSYTTEEKIDIIKNYKATPSDTDAKKKWEDLKTAIKNGDRSKDQMQLKVTATVEYQGVVGTATVIYDTNPKPKVNSSKAVTTMSDIGEGSGLFVLGGASSRAGEIYMSEGAQVVGSIFVKGNLYTSSQSDWYLFEDTVNTVGGNLTFTNVNPNVVESGAILYCMGTVKFTLDTAFGSPGKDTNIIGDKIWFADNAKKATYNGNLFCNTLSLTVEDGAQHPTINGKIYTNYVDVGNTVSVSGTNLVIDTSKNLYAAGFADKITVNKGIYINIGGSLEEFEYLGGTNNNEYKRISDGLTYYLVEQKDIDGDGTPDNVAYKPYNFDTSPSKEIKIGYTNTAHYTLKNDHKVFTLPGDLAGHTGIKEIEIPTTKAVYSEIFVPDAFVNEDPDVGTNGELDNTKSEMPQLDYTAITVTMDDGTVIPTFAVKLISEGTYDKDNSGKYVANGDLTQDQADYIRNHYDDWQTSWYPTEEFADGVTTKVRAAVNTAKQNPTYQTKLNDYYANYIKGSDKAGENLAKYKKGESKLDPESKPISNADNKEDFETGGKYAGLNAGGLINTSGYLDPTPGSTGDAPYGSPSSPIVIDARTSDIIIQLGASDASGSKMKFMGYFVVVGDKNVKFYLPDGRDYELGSNAGGQGFYVSTYDIHKATDLRLGNDANATPAPNVYMYVGNDVTNVEMPSPGADRLFTGYIYAPFSNFTFGADNGRTFSKVYYSGQDITDSYGFTVIGSIIAKSYAANKSGNKSGVAYISPDQNTTPAGDPHLGWIAYQYTRN